MPTQTQPILKSIIKRDAQETLNNSGWPKEFSPVSDNCPNCSSFIHSNRKKRNQYNLEEIVITQNNVVNVKIYKKKCNQCMLIIMADTLHLGLVNVGSDILFSLDIMFLMRSQVR